MLTPGGKIMVAVPDMNIPAQLFIKPEVKGADNVHVMRMMFGGQLDDTDSHDIGFDLEIVGVDLASRQEKRLSMSGSRRLADTD